MTDRQRDVAEIVLGFDVGPVHFRDLHTAVELLVLQDKLALHGLIAVSVHDVHHHSPVIVGARSVNIRHVPSAPALVLRTIHE